MRSTILLQYPSDPVMRPHHKVAVTYNFVKGCTKMLRRLQSRKTHLSSVPCLTLVSPDDTVLRSTDISNISARLFKENTTVIIPYARHDVTCSIFSNTVNTVFGHMDAFWERVTTP